MIKGRLVQAVKVQQVIAPAERATNAQELWNGAASNAAVGVDTQGFDDVMFVINTGVFNGTGSAAFSVLESATNDGTAATAIAGAAFTNVQSTNDDRLHVGSLRAQNYKRYLFLKSTEMGAGTIFFGATAILGVADGEPQDNSPVFKL